MGRGKREAEGNRDRGGNGGRGKSKRHKSRYLNASGGAAGPVANGSRGWLVSCVTGRERECGREIINVLDEWCDKLLASKGQAKTGEGASAGKAKGGSSIDALLANEVATLKKKARFVSVDSGCKALLFVRMTEGGKKWGGEKGGKQEEEEEDDDDDDGGVKEETEGGKESKEGGKEEKEGDKEQEKQEAGGKKEAKEKGGGKEEEKGESAQAGVSPCELAQAVLRHAKDTQQSATRFTLRLLPVETTCYASQEEIGQAIQPLIAAHFPAVGQSASDTPGDQPQGLTFAIIFEKRANEGLDRAAVIDTVAKLVPVPHKVDLSNPQRTIMLQVVKTVCFISILSDFKLLAKYNLRQLCLPPEEAKPAGEAKPSAAGESKPNSTEEPKATTAGEGKASADDAGAKDAAAVTGAGSADDDNKDA
ncbi:hypothetical protein CLOM_g9841 [Closterium sp. NIES-68]|nr:hypothetical protein CLOM_g9841 [Closterium sp. NIES-68]GJP65532.1 hypothetical protein CLOP_g22412 [Closterium sp. NIES-67]